MTEIEALSSYDAPTLKLGSAMHLRFRHPFFVMMRFLYLLLIPFGAILTFFGEQTFGILCVLLGPLLFLRKVFWQYRLTRGAISSSRAGQQLKWIFSDQGIRHVADGYDRWFEWQDFHERFLTPKGILLYLERDVYFVLPQQGFHSPKDFEIVSKWCSEKIQIQQK